MYNLRKGRPLGRSEKVELPKFIQDVPFKIGKIDNLEHNARTYSATFCGRKNRVDFKYFRNRTFFVKYIVYH